MLMLSQDSWPNAIGDSREEETFCVDTKHLRGEKKKPNIRTWGFIMDALNVMF